MSSRDVPEQHAPAPLPVASAPTGGRAAMTCRYRCGSACAHPAPNESDNPYLGDVISGVLSRRSMLRGVAVFGVAGAVGTALTVPAAAAPATRSRADGPLGAVPGLNFAPVAPNTADAVTIPDGYVQQVVVRWGEPIVTGAPAFAPNAQTAVAQSVQFGYNCDYLAVLDGGGRQLVMVANHEYTDEVLMFAGYDEENPTREQFEIALAAHGMSVVVLDDDRRGAGLSLSPGNTLNRRITGSTPIEITGPAAGSEFLRTSADPDGKTVLGTLNNCGGGMTPWGTVLSGEENFDQYFGNAEMVTDATVAARLKRYGLGDGASDRKWERFDTRFDVPSEPNEVNRFGYIVEIDPYDPEFVPRKRTALGRFKHEAAEPRLTRDGRVVLYMGDDERFDYLYKYVSNGSVQKGNGRRAREHNLTLLDDGTLYVATFTGNSPAAEIDGTGTVPADGKFDGGGEWIPLASGSQSNVPDMSAEEVYVFTRLAGDKVGATKMDRPEDVEPHPRTGVVYIALTNNTDRGAAGEVGVDEPNPRVGNKHGQIMELTEGDPGALAFDWNLFLVCGDPADPSTYFGGFPKDQVSPISCPDNVAFDEHGNLWIATDGNALESNDGLFGVPVDGDRRGEVKQFLTVPIGAETCGPVIRRDRVVVAVQHPGERDGATVETPLSTWPDGPGNLARPSVVNVHREGRPIG